MVYKKITGIRTLNEMYSSWMARGWMGVNYALFRRGPLTMAPSQLGAFTRSDPSQDRPNLQYHIQPLSLDKFGDPLHPFPAFTASVANLRPTSRGVINLKSADPTAAPAIRPNYLATPEDRRVAANSIRITRKISAQPAFAKYKPVEYLPGQQVRDDDEGALENAAGDIGTAVSTRSAPPGWAAKTTPMPWSTPGCGSSGSPDCGLLMPRLCPRSPLATPTHQRL